MQPPTHRHPQPPSRVPSVIEPRGRADGERPQGDHDHVRRRDHEDARVRGRPESRVRRGVSLARPLDSVIASALGLGLSLGLGLGLGLGMGMGMGMVLFLGMTGCRGPGRPGPEPLDREAAVELDPAAAAALIAAHGERVRRFERLWASCTVVIDGTDLEGRPLEGQGEGYLQVERPERVLLTLGKVGQTGFYFGSNPDAYWSMNTADRDDTFAVIGRHSAFNAEKATALGLPVRPLDLVWLLGVMPIPEGARVTRVGAGEADAPEAGHDVRFTLPGEADGGAGAVSGAGSGAEVRLELRGLLSEPRAIEVHRAGAVVRAEIDRYGPFEVAGDNSVRSRLGTRLTISAPSAMRGVVRLSLYDAQNRDIKAVSFDPAALIDLLGIDRVIDLDDPAHGLDAGPG